MKTLILALLMLIPNVSMADQEASNRTYVKTDEYGRCYAKSIPNGKYGTKGVTKIYQVNENNDTLVQTYDWFAPRLSIFCNLVSGSVIAPSVVQFGPWQRGAGPNPADFALAFYHNGKLLKKYSTSDIAGPSKSVSRSVGHYEVIKEVKGYRWIDSNSYAFDIVTADNKVVSFNPATGERLIEKK